MASTTGFAFIVGAPRCGTTSLSRYLARHPQICFSAVKEPHFFSQFDLSELDDEALGERVKDEYLSRYFADTDRRSCMLAEGSVTYLYAAERVKAVLRLWPDAKFIIAVRDPLAMLPSLHQRLLYLGDETVTDFAKAWALAPDRAAGKHIPRTCVAPEWLQYPEIGLLGKYVEQFVEAVGKERCFIAVQDDLVADPAGLYAGLIDFLGLPHDGRHKFKAKRAAQGYKIPWLQRFLKRPPRPVRSVMAGEHFRHRVKSAKVKRADPWLVRRVLAWRKRLLRWNRAPAPQVRLSPQMQAEIKAACADDVIRLSRLLKRDLSHWLGGIADATGR